MLIIHVGNLFVLFKCTFLKSSTSYRLIQKHGKLFL